MSDSQMKNVGQIQPAKKPTRDKINSAYQHSNPGSQMSWGGVHTSQHVGKNNQISCEIVYFHDGSPCGITFNAVRHMTHFCNTTYPIRPSIAPLAALSPYAMDPLAYLPTAIAPTAP